MTPGYCYFCDKPVDDDPCPTCGKTLHRPAADEAPKPPERTPELLSGEQPQIDRPTAWVKWVVAGVALVIIAFLLRSPFGI